MMVFRIFYPYFCFPTACRQRKDPPNICRFSIGIVEMSIVIWIESSTNHRQRTNLRRQTISTNFSNLDWIQSTNDKSTNDKLSMSLSISFVDPNLDWPLETNANFFGKIKIFFKNKMKKAKLCLLV